MSETNYQAVLNNALQLAAEADDPRAAIGLVYLHYHQSMLDAVRSLALCETCAAAIDVAQLQATARKIQQESFQDYQELIRACITRLDAMGVLCKDCLAHYQEQLLARFAQLHG